MTIKRYYIRSGAATTAGGTVRASSQSSLLDGVALACEGDPIDCPACGGEGMIRCVPPRLPDTGDGKEYALGDDLCICQCSPPPKLVADQDCAYQLVS